jgi:hypothetical protein
MTSLVWQVARRETQLPCRLIGETQLPCRLIGETQL